MRESVVALQALRLGCLGVVSALLDTGPLRDRVELGLASESCGQRLGSNWFSVSRSALGTERLSLTELPQESFHLSLLFGTELLDIAIASACSNVRNLQWTFG